jgi:hypothetical protein
MVETAASRRDLLTGAAALAASALLPARLGRGFQNSLPPVRAITRGPRFHWFGYYDKLEIDPSGRYVLGMESEFENRSPGPDDRIKVGMVDLRDGDRWIELGESRAWCWQQGCMLQWRPGSATEVVWNDREGDRFVCRILDVVSGKKRSVPHSIYAVSPDGKTAVTVDYGRLHTMAPGYGYAGVPDPNRDVKLPEDSGIFRVDLESGDAKLIVSIAQAAAIGRPFADMGTSFNYLKHLLFNPDGGRFVFVQRWYPKGPPPASSPRFTRLISAKPDGTDLRVIDDNGMTSHFIWRDPAHVLAFSDRKPYGARFYLFEDKEGGSIEAVGKDVMTQDGHCTYLPGKRWILNDTYPDGRRVQHPYLYHVAGERRVPLGHFHSPQKYSGGLSDEFRCDTHPRFSPDGRSVVIDSPHGEAGRQLHLIDIGAIVG